MATMNKRSLNVAIIYMVVKQMIIKRLLCSAAALLMIAFSFSVSANAEEVSEIEISVDTSYSEPEPSLPEQQSQTDISEEPSAVSEIPVEQPSESSHSESSYSYIADEISAESSLSDESSSDQSSSESSSETSNPYEEYSQPENSAENSAEVSELSVADPFEKIRSLQYIIPADDPDYESKLKALQNSAIRTAHIDGQAGLINTPIPTSAGSSELDLYPEERDSSFLMGVIIWSVIGIVVLILRILILNLKGGDFSFGRKRYHKHTAYKPMKGGKKYKYTGR